MESSALTLLFFLLFIASVVLLIAGLIWPPILKRLIKSVPTRKAIALFFSGLIVTSFIGVAVFVPHSNSRITADTVSEEKTNIEQEAQGVPVSTQDGVGAGTIEEVTAEKTVRSLPDQASSSTKTATPTPAPSQPTSAPAKPAPSQVPVVAPPAPTPATTTYFSVVSVTDGDTFKVSIDGKTDTIRIIGVDTPETVDPRKPVQCFGVEASSRAKALLTGKKVRLESDSVSGDRDKYNRLLRYVWLEDGTFFNETMISEGYAFEYTYQSQAYVYQSEFKKAEQNAKNSKLGLWADNACNQTTQSAVVPPVVSPPATAQPVPTTTSSHVFYTSSYHTAQYYYCDTDNGWKGLSPSYLKSFPSAEALLKVYSRTLHEPCK
ncbi:MAG: thermonuclease family protein [Patescibacteria group bacterium]